MLKIKYKESSTIFPLQGIKPDINCCGGWRLLVNITGKPNTHADTIKRLQYFSLLESLQRKKVHYKLTWFPSNLFYSISYYQIIDTLTDLFCKIIGF